jgi:hypothetical protein
MIHFDTFQRPCSAPEEEKTSASAEPRFFLVWKRGEKKNRGYAQAENISRFETLNASVEQLPRCRFMPL